MKLNMAVIGPSKGTKPERTVKMALVRNRIKHKEQVPFGPHGRWKADFAVGDIMVDVHGTHWHSSASKMNDMSWFWQNKIRTNRNRDRRKRDYCRKSGIRYIVLWERDVRRLSDSSIISKIVGP